MRALAVVWAIVWLPCAHGWAVKKSDLSGTQTVKSNKPDEHVTMAALATWWHAKAAARKRKAAEEMAKANIGQLKQLGTKLKARATARAAAKATWQADQAATAAKAKARAKAAVTVCPGERPYLWKEGDYCYAVASHFMPVNPDITHVFMAGGGACATAAENVGQYVFFCAPPTPAPTPLPPTALPTLGPTLAPPTLAPTLAPTPVPPSPAPTAPPSPAPTPAPTARPSPAPTPMPTPSKAEKVMVSVQALHSQLLALRAHRPLSWPPVGHIWRQPDRAKYAASLKDWHGWVQATEVALSAAELGEAKVRSHMRLTATWSPFKHVFLFV
jgi:hypothetical protein